MSWIALLEQLLGAAEVPVLRGADVRERGVRFRGMAVEHHRRRRARGRLGPHVGRTEHAVVGEQAVGIRQAAVRQRELRVFDDRLLEELDRLVQAFFGALIEVVAALQVQIARREVVGLRAARRARRRHRPRAPPCRRPAWRCFLAGERIGELDVGGFGPQVKAARAVDEVNGDAQAIARRAHAAGDHQRGVRRIAFDWSSAVSSSRAASTRSALIDVSAWTISSRRPRQK